MRISNVVFQALRNTGAGGSNGVVRQNDVAIPAVKFPRDTRGRRFTAGFDFGQKPGHCGADIGRGGCINRRPALQIAKRHSRTCMA